MDANAVIDRYEALRQENFQMAKELSQLQTLYEDTKEENLAFQAANQELVDANKEYDEIDQELDKVARENDEVRLQN